MRVGHHFEQRHEVDVPATPEQVWAAIATGAGIDSWFMGRTDVEAGAGGLVRTSFGGYAPEHTITAWEPSERLAYGTGAADDGRAIAYEFLIEGRSGGSTVVRMVTSGFLPGDDWEDEYDAMTQGIDLFFRTLEEYLGHFAGRTATPITAVGPPVADWPAAWATLRAAMGLTGPGAEGDRVRFAPAGVDAVDGTVYVATSQTLGVRTENALYRFLQGFHGGMVAGHHLFTDAVDATASEAAWQSWLTQVLAPSRPARSEHDT